MKNVNTSKIGILSDTHDQIQNLIKVIEFFNHEQVDLVIHCGDWTSPFTLIHYAKLQVPLYGVFGNNDGDKFRHIKYAQKFGLNVHFEDRLLVMSEFGKKIVIYHGDYDEIVDALVKCGDYDLVLHGHNHCAKIAKFNKVLSLNPGTLVDFTNDEVQDASFGLYNANTHEGEIIWLKNL
ncbi:MAG: metallophosphoesterase [Candidatus Heimdallarchaeota archaeon]|nr:metallophosphoesterase [Candidatus Heimdallarchaeota archaeon]